MLLDEIKSYIVPSIASHKDISKYPILVSPCIAGIRVYIENGIIYDINKKPLKNKKLQEMIKTDMEDLEGVYEAVVNLAFSNELSLVQEAVNSLESLRDKDIIVHIHDWYINEEPLEYTKRILHVTNLMSKIKNHDIAYLPQKLIYSLPQLKKFEKAVALSGYDGIIIRTLDTKYSEPGSIIYKPLTLV